MKNKLNYILIIICCCGLANAGLSLATNCAGLFFAPVADSLQVNIGDTSLFLTIYSVMTGLFGVTAVKTAQKYNVRFILFLCAATSAIGYFLMSLITTTWQMYLLAIILGSINAFYGMSMISLIIGNWFHKNMGTATGIAFSFSGLASSGLSIILNGLIENAGWRTTYIIVGFMIILSVLPSILFLRMFPSEKGMVPFGYDSAKVASDIPQKSKAEIRFKDDKVFWIMCLIPAFAAFITGFCTHLSGFGTSIGLTASIGALMVSASMIGNTSSKLGMGVLCDLLGAKKALRIMLGMSSLGLLMLLICSRNANKILLIVAAICIGMSFSTCGVGMSNMVKEIYGPDNFGHVYASLSIPISVGGAVSYSVIGFSYDIFGSYYPIAATCMVMGIVSIICVEVIYRKMK